MSFKQLLYIAVYFYNSFIGFFDFWLFRSILIWWPLAKLFLFQPLLVARFSTYVENVQRALTLLFLYGKNRTYKRRFFEVLFLFIPIYFVLTTPHRINACLSTLFSPLFNRYNAWAQHLKITLELLKYKWIWSNQKIWGWAKKKTLTRSKRAQLACNTKNSQKNPKHINALIETTSTIRWKHFCCGKFSHFVCVWRINWAS